MIDINAQLAALARIGALAQIGADMKDDAKIELLVALTYLAQHGEIPRMDKSDMKTVAKGALALIAHLANQAHARKGGDA